MLLLMMHRTPSICQSIYKIRHLLIFFCTLITAWIFFSTDGWCQEQSPPSWQSSSTGIGYASYTSDHWEIWLYSIDEKRHHQITNSFEEKQYPGLAPKENKLAFATNLGELWIAEPGRDPQKIPRLPENCTHPAWSPDGRKLVFVAYTFIKGKEDSDLWIADLDKNTVNRLIQLEKIQKHPCWSPDGQSIVFTSAYLPDSGKPIEDLYMINANGTDPKPWLSNGAANIQPNWSHRGDKIVFASNHSGNMEIWVKGIRDETALQLTDHPAYDGDPCWSPDGRHICFVSTRSGKMDVWIMDADGANPWQVTGLGGRQGDSKDPHWAP
jgi:TolB protein